MTLLFGNLINEFVKFQAIINDINNGDSNAIERLPAVAASFRSQAASNALYLVFIGTLNCYIVHSRWLPHL